jgi:hypothetical protein
MTIDDQKDRPKCNDLRWANPAFVGSQARNTSRKREFNKNEPVAGKAAGKRNGNFSFHGGAADIQGHSTLVDRSPGRG